MQKAMHTTVEKVPADNPQVNISAIKNAAVIIRNSGLVAVPTETVYGLGANALSSDAVKKIFDAKGRPQDNPLIVHIADMSDIERVAINIPPLAYILAEKFWPGALTMVLEKSADVPYETTAGLDSVAVRLPSHETMRLLIKESGTPIAAPSANSSGKPSATEAGHVICDLSGKINMILDSGPCGLGIESTVIDLTVSPPCVLRPGSITLEQLKEVDCSIVAASTGSTAEINNDEAPIAPKSPGVKYTHYSPKAELIVVCGDSSRIVAAINELLRQSNGKSNSKKIAILASEENVGNYIYDEKSVQLFTVGSRENIASVARELFRVLRLCDELGIELIYAEAYPQTGLGASVMDRLIKAAGYNIMNA